MPNNPLTNSPQPNSDLPYGEFGIIPGVAQAAQNAVYMPNLYQAPSFNTAQAAVAHWFTTRVHLSPLGEA